MAETTPSEAARMERAADIFVEVRSLGLAAREESIARYCGNDAALRDLVQLFLRGDQAPLRVESLADDIRAAHDAASTVGRPDAGSYIGGGRYHLLERIGEGGFGVVFAANQTEPVKRKVALKIIKLGMDTRQVVARFEAERQALAMMDHPNIAKVFDAGATETGRPYFVMELVRGLPITDYCDARKFDIFARLDLFAKVCDAVQHAHQKGVIHRDIKPGNILVTESGEHVIPKVIDFGIAKATTAELTEKTVFTELRQMIGTPEYMSPEQAGISALDVDTRTDVYSVGVLLYELLTGSTPFDSKRLRSAAYGEVQRIIRDEEPPRPSTRLTQLQTRATVATARGTEPARLGTVLKGELDWVVMKCLEKDRALRYDSAGALMRDVRRFVAGEAVQAVPPSTVYRVRKFVRKNKGPVLAASLVAFVLVAGLIGTTLGFVNADAQRKDALKQQKRADDKTTDALAAEALANRSAYSANMLSACTAFQSNQLSGLRAFLDAAPEQLRGWEWRVLRSRLDTSVRALSCLPPGHKPAEGFWDSQLLLHPDGQSFFTIRCLEREAAQRWDLGGKLLATFERPTLKLPEPEGRTQFTLSPDGERLWAFDGNWITQEPPTVAGWDLRTNERVLRQQLPALDTAAGVIALTPDGQRILRCQHDKLWLQDVASGSVLAQGEGWEQYSSYRFSSDGSLVALASDRGAIRILDGRTLKPVVDLVGHKNQVTSIAFSSDNRTLVCSSVDSSARIWDLAANPPSAIVLSHPNQVDVICLSPDASLVATLGVDGTIRVWESATGTPRGVYSSGTLIRSCLMFMPDGRTIAGRERDGTVRFWDIAADATVNLPHHQGILNGAYFADQAGVIVSAGWDGWRGQPGVVRVSDAETGDQIAATGEPGEIAYRISVAGGKAAVVITAVASQWTSPSRVLRSRIEIYDLLNGSCFRHEFPEPVSAPATNVVAFALDPRGQSLVLGRDGRLEVRSSVDLSLLASREQGLEGKTVLRAAWSPDARSIACMTGNASDSTGELFVVDARTLATVVQLPVIAGTAAFSPDGSVLCAGSPDGTVHLFRTSDWSPLQTLSAHDGYISSVAFSPDGARLATAGGHEGDIRIWDAATLSRLARFHFDDFVASVSWSADSSRLIAACGRTIRIWDETPLRERLQFRDARRAAIASIQPRIASLLRETGDPAKAFQRFNADDSLAAQVRKAGRQLLLKAAFQERSSPGTMAP